MKPTAKDMRNFVYELGADGSPLPFTPMSTYLIKYSLIKYLKDGEADTIGLPLVEWFIVEADDIDHAVEQLVAAYPEANLVAGYKCVPVTPIIQV